MTKLLESCVYDPQECAVFCKSKDPLGSLQNMTGGMPIKFGNLTYQSSEGAYQAQKFVGRPDIQEAIAKASNGFSAKIVAKKYRQHIDLDWEERKILVMVSVLQTKFARHTRRILDDVGPYVGRPLVELSRKDAFWGAKLREDGMLEGVNLLGKLWEVVLDSERFQERLREISMMSPPKLQPHLQESLRRRGLG